MVGHVSGSNETQALNAAQAGLVAALMEFIEFDGRELAPDKHHNPLWKLREEIFPRWRKVCDRYRRLFPPTRHTYQGNESLSRFKRELLESWACNCEIRAQSGVPAWVVRWASGEFDRCPEWLTRSTVASYLEMEVSEPVPILPLCADSPSGPVLSPPGPWGIGVEILDISDKKERHRFIDEAYRAWAKGTNKPGGRPKNPEYPQYLALALCQWRRDDIANKFNITVNAKQKGLTRATQAAGIVWSFKPDR